MASYVLSSLRSSFNWLSMFHLFVELRIWTTFSNFFNSRQLSTGWPLIRRIREVAFKKKIQTIAMLITSLIVFFSFSSLSLSLSPFYHLLFCMLEEEKFHSKLSNRTEILGRFFSLFDWKKDLFEISWRDRKRKTNSSIIVLLVINDLSNRSVSEIIYLFLWREQSCNQN